MKKIKILLFILVGFHTNCISQKAIKKGNGGDQHSTFSDVHCLLLINYAHGLSFGEYIYPTYSIKKKGSAFVIEATDRKNQPISWSVPFTTAEMKKISKTDTDKSGQLQGIKLNPKSDHYISEVVQYKINDTVYNVYKHLDYNCYDRFCGTRHNHTTFPTGVTFFSPDYGILVQVDNQNMQFNLMARMKEKKIPHDLVIEILKSMNTDKRIIQQYIAKTISNKPVRR
jgi:hypothetical protein